MRPKGTDGTARRANYAGSAGSQAYRKQSDITTVTGPLARQPKVASKPKDTADGNSSMRSLKATAPKPPNKQASSPAVTSRKLTKAKAKASKSESAKPLAQCTPQMIADQLGAFMSAVRALGSRKQSPEQVLVFTCATPLTQAMQDAVDYVLPPDIVDPGVYADKFNKGQAESFVFRFASYLGMLVRDTSSDPALQSALMEAIRTIDEMLTVEFNESVPGFVAPLPVARPADGPPRAGFNEQIEALQEAIVGIACGEGKVRDHLNSLYTLLWKRGNSPMASRL
jgi:hypothetical protein